MASPQIENGYTKIANELFEALCKIRIPGEARQVFDVVTRKTYGYNKSEDKIALSQLCLATGLRRSNVCRALNMLVSMNLIIKKETSNSSSYRINKDFDSWRALSNKRPQSQKRVQGSLLTDNKPVSKEIHTKEINKTTKETTEQGSEEVVAVIDAFKQVNPSYQMFFGRNPQRNAVKRLLKVHEKEKLLRVITLLPKSNDLPYFPSITSPVQLESKWAQLESAFKRKKVEIQEKVSNIIL